MVSFRNNRVFVGATNFFRVVAQQVGPVQLDQLSATLQTYGEEKEPPLISLEIKQNGNMFTIHPKEIGVVNISIDLVDRTERYSFFTKQLDAIAQVGGKSGGLIPAVVFKAQKGVYMIVVGYDICVGCKVISYEIIRITSDHQAEIAENIGGNWEDAATKLISDAQPGDRYIFDKIVYLCPGNVKSQQAEAMSFEVD